MSLIRNRRIGIGWLLVALTASPSVAATDVPMLSTNRFAWSENAGWMNASPSNGVGAVIHFDGNNSFLSGCVWCENAGYVSLASSSAGPFANTQSNNWGVNMNGDWQLSGFGWSESLGWINFAPSGAPVIVDCLSGRFRGKAWSENAGWLTFEGDAPGASVQALIRMATNNVPHWWLGQYGWTNDYDDAAMGDLDADRALTWEEWIAGTNPTNGASIFQCLEISSTNFPMIGKVLRWSAVSGRVYAIDGATNLTQGWFGLATNLPPSGVWTDTTHGADGTIHYRLEVRKP